MGARQQAGQALDEVLGAVTDAAVPALTVTGVALDSRDVCPGDLFLAAPGAATHGLDHLNAAIANGAVAVAWDHSAAPECALPSVHVPGLDAAAGRVAARVYGEPSQSLLMTGVTGTDGKTSCAWLVAHALTALGQRCGVIGTLGAGLPDALAPLRHTTPDPAVLQARLAAIRAAGGAAVALEASSHALDQGRLKDVAVDVAVLTGIGRDHLDYHATQAAYVRAKRRLFEQPGLAAAVINADDRVGQRWLGELAPHVTTIAYGRDVGAAERFVQIQDVSAQHDGLRIRLASASEVARLDSPLLGAFNAANLAAAAAVLSARGYDLTSAVGALANAPCVPGRMERVAGSPGAPTVVVDYAHTPGALRGALASLRAHAARHLICVFGAGGDRDRGKRAAMGESAAGGADRLWITDDNPRFESPETIVADILDGVGATAYRVEHDRRAAIEAAVHGATADDVILIAGKGHETTQQVGAYHRAFDDREAARAALEAL